MGRKVGASQTGIWFELRHRVGLHTLTSNRRYFSFTNLGTFLSFVSVAGVSSLVTFLSKLEGTGANAILSQSCDLAQYQQLIGSSSGTMGILYPRTVIALSHLLPGFSRDIAIAAALLVALTLVGAFLVTSVLLGDARAGLLASIVSVFLISAAGMVQLSEYAFLEGLAFALLAAAFLFGSLERRRLWLLPVAVLSGLFAGLSDPYWGLILFAGAAGTMLLSFVAKVSVFRASWATTATVPALAASTLTLVLYHSAPASLSQIDWVLMIILTLAASWGGTSLVLKRSRSTVILLVPLAIASVIVSVLSSLQYSILPLALLGTMSLASVGSRMLTVERRYSPKAGRMGGNEVFDIGIDLVKLFSVIPIVILVLSSGFLGSFSFAGDLLQQRTESNSYGSSQTNQALNWIRTNTSAGSVIAAPQDFGNWVQTYAGRTFLSGGPSCPSSPYPSSPQAQANNLLLNSNVELRNEYLMLRDGSPYWTMQTPMFSISNGSSFADVIQTTDAYNRIGFSFAGSNWIEAPYHPKNFTSNWVVRNSSEASFRMIFTTDAFEIEKTMTLSEGSKEASLTYSVSPLNQAQLHSMNLTLWIPYNETVGNLTESGGTFQLPVNNKPILISSDPLPTNESLSNVGGQYNVVFEYKISANTFSVTLHLNFPSAVRSSWSAGLHGLTSDEIIKQYSVGYLVVLNQARFSSRLDLDPRFKLEYSNSNILIYAFEPG